MDDLLHTLYNQYDRLIKEREKIEGNLSKLADMIVFNGGQVPLPAIKKQALPTTSHSSENVTNKAPVAFVARKAYNEKMSWIEKIMHALYLLNKPASVTMIVNCIKDLEPAITKKIDKSVTLNASKMGKEGLIGVQKKEGENKNYYYIK